MADSQDLLFELGTEELPPKSLLTLRNALEEGIVAGLKKADLAHGEIIAYATPRRLAVWIKDLATAQPDRTVERRGPAVKATYQADGSPSKAAEGFARSCGVSLEQMGTIKTDKGEWLAFSENKTGKPTEQLIGDILSKSLTALPVAKRMRWGSGTTEFVRPVKWVVLLFGTEVINSTILGIKADRNSRGHRFHAPALINIREAASYAEQLLESGHVEVSFETRRTQIEQQAIELAGTVSGHAHIEPALLDEITALVEWPVGVMGGIDERFLALPAEVLITTMQDNQKYFPVKAESGELLPWFITFSNIDSTNPESVRKGNERVVRPRLADAEFFWNQDRKQPLENRVEKLGSIIFQKQLGTLLDKTERVEKLAALIAEEIGADKTLSRRAAHLAKTDLMTEMVGEFASLQGIIGRYYAAADGEPGEVAQAIEEQYFPKQSGGKLPECKTGQVLALAEKLDTLCGIFSAGLMPTGDKDPYALRRAAIGILRIILEKRLDLNLVELIEKSCGLFSHEFDREKTQKLLLTFCLERLKGLFLEEGFSADELDAVLSVHPTRPLDFEERLQAVKAFRSLPESESLAAANKRIRNILRKAGSLSQHAVDTKQLIEPAEKQLWEQTQNASEAIAPLLSQRDYSAALKRLALLREVTDLFFDEVMVMADDEAIRNNRLTLLSATGNLFLSIADISKLQ
ncbi:MAG: glycine--tRNA ligase subunit beta [Gammaproteobacteria bacterium]|nr:MAG: glycine--tRNA ligase subunit beta [Gammaproteobacteria bacterium]